MFHELQAADTHHSLVMVYVMMKTTTKLVFLMEATAVEMMLILKTVHNVNVLVEKALMKSD